MPARPLTTASTTRMSVIRIGASALSTGTCTLQNVSPPMLVQVYLLRSDMAVVDFPLCRVEKDEAEAEAVAGAKGEIYTAVESSSRRWMRRLRQTVG